jgi:hypothetical protein
MGRIGPQIHARTSGSFVLWQWKGRLIDDFNFQNRDIYRKSSILAAKFGTSKTDQGQFFSILIKYTGPIFFRPPQPAICT